VREVVDAEHVLDRVDREADVGAVLGRREREELHEVDRAVDELAAVARVHGRGPVGVGAGDRDRAERGREVEHRVDVDRRLLEALGRHRAGGDGLGA
jgi:hypothetical protein